MGTGSGDFAEERASCYGVPQQHLRLERARAKAPPRRQDVEAVQVLIDRHADGDRGRHGSRVPGYWVTVIEATKLGYSDGGWILQ
jgi:hypothetical protein